MWSSKGLPRDSNLVAVMSITSQVWTSFKNFAFIPLSHSSLEWLSTLTLLRDQYASMNWFVNVFFVLNHETTFGTTMIFQTALWRSSNNHSCIPLSHVNLYSSWPCDPTGFNCTTLHTCHALKNGLGMEPCVAYYNPIKPCVWVHLVVYTCSLVSYHPWVSTKATKGH